MNVRRWAPAVAMLLWFPSGLAAQVTDGSLSVPQTSWGAPDLQGVWTNSTTTPLERPQEWNDHASLTVEEVAEIDAQAEGRNDRPPRAGDPGTYNEFWWDRGRSLSRTSLIVDSPDGRMPALTNVGRARGDFRQSVDSWEDRNLAERCVTRGAPKRPGGYNNNFQILQTSDYIAIVQEMIHEVRVIPLDERPPVDDAIRLWMGDSRGRWEGDTLVVETTNYDDRIVANSFNCCGRAGVGLRLTERFRLVNSDTIDYEYTVDDSTIYTQPWTVGLPMTRIAGPLYEYACHEGNYGLENILRGSRIEERTTADR